MYSLFQHIELTWIFLGIPVMALLFWALLQWKKKVIKRIGDKKLVKALVQDYSPRLFAAKFIVVSIAFSLGVIAVMNPRKPGGKGSVTRNGIDVAITLDVSKSMLATDLQPSRLQRAKQLIAQLMDKMPDNRIALILFAGKAYLQMPLSLDHGAAAMYLSAAGPDAVPQQGTVISDALNMSAAAFNSADQKFKAVVLISDGEDHDEDAIKTAAALSQQGVMINAVGIGSAEGATIPDPVTGEAKKDASGNTVITKLDEDELKQIASKTNGIYVHLQGTDEAVNALLAQLSQIDRKAFGDQSLMNFRTYYAWFAGAMFFLLLLENFIGERKRKIA